jgi:hypothetical protein
MRDNPNGIQTSHPLYAPPEAEGDSVMIMNDSITVRVDD